MRSKLVLVSFMFVSLVVFSQSETEVFLLDLSTSEKGIEFSNAVNVSENPGYDNQPSFINNNILTYSRTNGERPDIALYNINEKSTAWFNTKTAGGEYSPQAIPLTQNISAVRLDPDGKQLLYQYDLGTGLSQELVPGLLIGYYVWKNPSTLVSFVLGDSPSLVVSHLETKTHDTIQSNIGRALHIIPNSQLVSFVDKQNDTWVISSLDTQTRTIKKIVPTLPGVEDLCWTQDGKILAGKGSFIYSFNPDTDTEWQRITSLRSQGITKITRLTISPDGKRLAVVGETVKTDPEGVVQEQLDAYNSGDVDWFMDTYSKDVKLFNFPNTKLNEGLNKMRDQYAGFFKATPDLHCEIKNRIVIGNKVIDEEYITANGQHFSAVAVYEIENGLISKVTFIR